MTDREALREAMRILQTLHRAVRGLAERVTLIEQVLGLEPRPVPTPKSFELTPEQIAEIESEIESKQKEDPC